MEYVLIYDTAYMKLDKYHPTPWLWNKAKLQENMNSLGKIYWEKGRILKETEDSDNLMVLF